MKSVKETESLLVLSSETASSDSSKTTSRDPANKAQNTKKNVKSKDRVYSDLPKNDRGQIDKDRIKDMFLKSAHFQWTDFAQDMGWDPVRTRTSVPFKTWQEDKRRDAAEMAAVNVQKALFDHRATYQQEVLKTLRNYPKIADSMAGIIQMKLKEYHNVGRLQELPPPDPQKDGEAFQRWSDSVKHWQRLTAPSQLAFMTQAIKNLTETKQKSLMMDRWSINQAEEAALPPSEGGGDFGNQNTWTMTVIGHENVTLSDLQELANKYYDKPRKQEPVQAEEAQILVSEGPDDEPDDE